MFRKIYEAKKKWHIAFTFLQTRIKATKLYKRSINSIARIFSNFKMQPERITFRVRVDNYRVISVDWYVLMWNNIDVFINTCIHAREFSRIQVPYGTGIAALACFLNDLCWQFESYVSRKKRDKSNVKDSDANRVCS